MKQFMHEKFLVKKILSLILLVCFSLSVFSAFAELNISAQDLQNASDEELESLRLAVMAEQKSRIKTKIVLDQEELKLEKGGSVKLTAVVTELPEGVKEGKLVWETGDKAIATVQNGAVKAVGAGETTISCSTTLSDGTEISSECKVSVWVPVKSIKFKNNKVKIVLNSEDHSYRQDVIFQPADATDQKVKYTVSDPQIACVDEDGLVHLYGVGTVTITATTTDGSEKSASYTITSEVVKASGDTSFMFYDSYYPDKEDYYCLSQSDHNLELDGFSIRLDTDEKIISTSYSVFSELRDPCYAQVAFYKKPPYDGWALEVANIHICDVENDSDEDAFSEKCMEACQKYMRYNLSLWNNDPSFEQMVLKDVDEPVKTVIANEPCIKRRTHLGYPDSDNSFGNETILYCFPEKGYVFAVGYTYEATEDVITLNPDELLSSVLTWY